MKILITLLFAVLLVPEARASSSRIEFADTIQNTTGGSVMAFPSSGTSVSSDTNAQTYQNKSISGSTNTLSQLPITAQINQDLFYGNGSSTSLTLSGGPPIAAGVTCYLDGLLMDQGTDYSYTYNGSLTPGTVTLAAAAATGQKIKCVYSKY